MLVWYSLLLRRNLTSVSNICKAAPVTLLWAPNALNELQEERFDFPFILNGKWTLWLF